MHRRTLTMLVLGATLAVAGCHTMSFEVADGTPAKIVHDRKSFYFWGLTPTRNVDVLQFCPDGALAVSEETTFVDGLCNFFTLGIWAPRSSYYHCAVGGT